MQLSSSARERIDQLAEKHGFSAAAVTAMLQAVINGNGTMAQFNHPEFSGPGQWMKGGMTMVSDMFNTSLKQRVDALCSDLSQLLADQPELAAAGDSSGNSGAGQDGGRQSGNWWPSDLRSPNSTGSQNDMRYAYFASARRLAVGDSGGVTVYDTLDHQISGVSQQQSSGSSVKFSSQRGTVDLASLPVVSTSR